MSTRPELRLDWCSHAAAKYAVERWHYSRIMPKSKLARLGVWEDGRFIGAVIFGVGAQPNLGKPFGLRATEVCELVRVALAKHTSPVSRIVAIALRMVKAGFPGLRAVVSYADPVEGHHGGIYQAGNWIYTGYSEPTGGREYFLNGRWVHTRALSLMFGTRAMAAIDAKVGAVPTRHKSRRHRYAMPFDAEIRAKIVPLAKPYPKRPRAESIDSDATANHAGEGGAEPTSALRSTDGDTPCVAD